VKHYSLTVLSARIFAASIWSITRLPQGFLPGRTPGARAGNGTAAGLGLRIQSRSPQDIVARLRQPPEVKQCSR